MADQDPQDKIPEDIVKIVIHDRHTSLLKRIFGKIGGLFKGGSHVQSEGSEEEGGESDEAREEERKANEKDLFEREPWHDPNAIPPVPIDELAIGPDPETATELEEAALVPKLNGESSTEHLVDALRRVASSEGSPEAKAEMFTRFAAQISLRSGHQWRQDAARGDDGSYIFIGASGYRPVHVVVISPQGQVFVGNYMGFTITGTGAMPRYDRLKPVR